MIKYLANYLLQVFRMYIAKMLTYNIIAIDHIYTLPYSWAISYKLLQDQFQRNDYVCMNVCTIKNSTCVFKNL